MRGLSPLRTVAWLSHERPEALKRSITSFVNGCGALSTSYRYIVAESGAFQSRPDYLPSKNLIYIDDTFRESLIHRLEKGIASLGGPVRAVRFALDAKRVEGTEGVHRNTIALLTQGEVYLSSDDDIVFDIKSLNDSSKQCTSPGESNFLPFKNFAELDLHEGRSVSLLNFMASHENALQSATFSSPGIRGDSAFGGPRFIFTFDDSSLTSFCKNPNFVSEALGSRVMWRETAHSHIAPYASLATYTIGMNNQRGLAPCFPFGRNVDGAFVFATKALHTDAQTAQLSHSVLHRPLTDRGAYSSLDILKFRINDLLWLMWSEWLDSVSLDLSVQDRHRAAAAYFQGIAKQSQTDFRDFLRQLTSRSLSDRSNRLERQIQRLRNKGGSPGLEAWVQIAEREVHLCRQMAFANNLLLPEEVRCVGRTQQDELQMTQGWIASYGELLEVWPAMCQLMQQEEYKENLQSL